MFRTSYIIIIVLYFGMKTSIFLLVAIAALGAVGIVTAITMSQAYAAKTCAERGLNPGCSPGQHVNTHGNTDNNIVGNPHYPQIGGDKTGDPHGGTHCNPDNGNPHSDTSVC
jgi:hypothetical protein